MLKKFRLLKFIWENSFRCKRNWDTETAFVQSKSMIKRLVDELALTKKEEEYLVALTSTRLCEIFGE
jgi:hypothetical protein